MLTAIYTEQTTQLSIQTAEPIRLEKMGEEDGGHELEAGTHQLTIGPGLFRVISEEAVIATAPGGGVQVWAHDKDGDPPPSPRIVGALDPAATSDFLSPLRSTKAPA